MKRGSLPQAKKRQHREVDRKNDMEQIRSRFFANISHEFRTPLSLILAPLETLLQAAPQDSKEHILYLMMERNARRLLNLINQLLDLSKLEAGSLHLELKPGEVIGLLDALAVTFMPLAENRQINFTYQLPATPWVALFDSDKLEKIVVNLLSNACKYTPDGGAISLEASIHPDRNQKETKQVLTIAVTDNGKGIEANQVDKIFDRFYVADTAQEHNRESTGIGLALTKELVELHGGRISVQSKPQQGTRFVVELPLETATESVANSENSADALKGSFLNALAAGQPALFTAYEKELIGLSSTYPVSENEKPVLLIVEDNRELSAFMALHFHAEYQVIEAENGEVGWQKALETIPDLVISDVMMPVMDGIELCRKLKADERTSHVSVMLLTAKAGQENMLEGLETGADDYLTKPFSVAELQLRARNMVEGRRKLRERFSRDGMMYPTDGAVTSADEKFLRRVIAIIIEHIDEDDFTAEVFEREVGLSHVQFYRKMKALTNQAPGEFLRNYRLQQAAHLLKGKHGNVTEVAYTVGFTSLAYFTRCFKARFGKTPSEYITL